MQLAVKDETKTRLETTQHRREAYQHYGRLIRALDKMKKTKYIDGPLREVLKAIQEA